MNSMPWMNEDNGWKGFSSFVQIAVVIGPQEEPYNILSSTP